MNLNFLKKKKTFRKGGSRANADLAWEIVLYTAFVVIIAVFVFGFYTFIDVNRDKTFSLDGEVGQIKIVSKEAVLHALEYFSAREEKSTGILHSPSPLVDPSL